MCRSSRVARTLLISSATIDSCAGGNTRGMRTPRNADATTSRSRSRSSGPLTVVVIAATGEKGRNADDAHENLDMKPATSSMAFSSVSRTIAAASSFRRLSTSPATAAPRRANAFSAASSSASAAERIERSTCAFLSSPAAATYAICAANPSAPPEVFVMPSSNVRLLSSRAAVQATALSVVHHLAADGEGEGVDLCGVSEGSTWGLPSFSHAIESTIGTGFGATCGSMQTTRIVNFPA
eukprot:scaffold83273_cov30-Tisochrysis_lutea.AAC.6